MRKQVPLSNILFNHFVKRNYLHVFNNYLYIKHNIFVLEQDNRYINFLTVSFEMNNLSHLLMVKIKYNETPAFVFMLDSKLLMMQTIHQLYYRASPAIFQFPMSFTCKIRRE